MSPFFLICEVLFVLQFLPFRARSNDGRPRRFRAELRCQHVKLQRDGQANPVALVLAVVGVIRATAPIGRRMIEQIVRGIIGGDEVPAEQVFARMDRQQPQQLQLTPPGSDSLAGSQRSTCRNLGLEDVQITIVQLQQRAPQGHAAARYSSGTNANHHNRLRLTTQRRLTTRQRLTRQSERTSKLYMKQW